MRLIAKSAARLTAFLIFVFMTFPGYAAPSQQGLELFRDKGCSGCHSIGAKGGTAGPALDFAGDRYSGEWIYKWLRDPAAVKPGTKMPDLHLTDNERALLALFLSTKRAGSGSKPVTVRRAGGVTTDPPELNPKSPENDYLQLGVNTSYVRRQRYTLQDQIQSFIPPLYEPAFTQPAFVLPPGAFRLGISYRHVGTIVESDFAGQNTFGSRVEDLDLRRRFLDFDFLLGLDDNFTVRLNLPFQFSRVDAGINPAFNSGVEVFPQGSVVSVGDVKLFVKKKFFDQGNYPISLAAAAVLRLPTGPNHLKFDGPTAANVGGVLQLLPLPAANAAGAIIPGSADGTFRRFGNDGRLPAPLQPGLGTVGGAVGLFATRIFEGNTVFGRGAFHAGALYEIRPKADGVDPGNQLTAFASLVKPVIGDTVSVDFTYLAKYQEEDSYDGFVVTPGPVVVPRAPFSGGTTHFLAGSLIVIPNPLLRLTLSGLVRVVQPRLGPSPAFVIRASAIYTFATGLYQSGITNREQRR